MTSQLTGRGHPATLFSPSPHATVGRGNPSSIGAQRHHCVTSAFFAPVVRLFNGGLGGARFGVAGFQYAGFPPPPSPSPNRCGKRSRRFQLAVLESVMSKSTLSQSEAVEGEYLPRNNRQSKSNPMSREDFECFARYRRNSLELFLAQIEITEPDEKAELELLAGRRE